MSTLFAFFHHVAAFTLVSALAIEFILIGQEFSLGTARRLVITDAVLGASAAFLLVVGLLRVFYFEKGPAFYSHNPFFWLKMNAFLAVGLLSIDPTIRYLRWNKVLKENQAPEINEKEFKRTRLLLSLEVIGLAIILFAAAMMARGIGMS